MSWRIINSFSSICVYTHCLYIFCCVFTTQLKFFSQFVILVHFLLRVVTHMAVTCGRGTKRKIIIIIRVFVLFGLRIYYIYIIYCRGCSSSGYTYTAIAKEWVSAAGGHSANVKGVFVLCEAPAEQSNSMGPWGDDCCDEIPLYDLSLSWILSLSLSVLFFLWKLRSNENNFYTLYIIYYIKVINKYISYSYMTLRKTFRVKNDCLLYIHYYETHV